MIQCLLCWCQKLERTGCIIHSPIHHFGQVDRVSLEGERWSFWIWAAWKEQLCLHESVFQMSLPWGETPFLLRKLFPRLSSWQYTEPQVGPLYVFGKCSPLSGSSKNVLPERAARNVCTPCFWFFDPEVWGQLGLAVEENKVLYSDRLNIRFKTTLQKQNQIWLMVLVRILNG